MAAALVCMTVGREGERAVFHLYICRFRHSIFLELGSGAGTFGKSLRLVVVVGMRVGREGKRTKHCFFALLPFKFSGAGAGEKGFR